MSLPNIPHEWLFPVSLSEAAEVQRILSKRILVEDQFEKITHVAGMDVSNNLFDPTQRIYASAVVLEPKLKQVVDKGVASIQQKFPYIPGFLGFREAPALISAYQKLNITPSLIMVDGHGISHPRGLGIASHIGALLDCPTVGVAKTILIGEPKGNLGEAVGSTVPLLWHNKQIAVVLRTKVRCKPLIISPGHKISFETAVKLVMAWLTKYRLPEPTRQAHLAANVFRQESKN